MFARLPVMMRSGNVADERRMRGSDSLLTEDMDRRDVRVMVATDLIEERCEDSNI
jgi:hypothetical protein